MTNILSRIDEVYASSSKSEQKLARFILNSPHKLVSMSNETIANELNISVSTMNRYSQKLINQNFKAIRDEIKQWFPKQVTPYNIKLVENESVESLKQKLYFQTKTSLKQSNHFIDHRIIDAICERFKQAHTIFLYGYGTSYVCALEFYQKLSRIGLNIQLVQDTHLLTTMLSTHNKNDCVVFITNSGEQSELQAMVKVVKDFNLSMITITSSNHNSIAKDSDLVLTYNEDFKNELCMSTTTSLFAQLYTIDIIFYRFIARNYHTSLDFMTQSKIALDNYHKYLSKIEFKH